MPKPIILIWETIPEETRVYRIPNDRMIYDATLESAGLYINSSDIPDDHAIKQLNDWIESNASKPYLAGSRENPVIDTVGGDCKIVMAGFCL